MGDLVLKGSTSGQITVTPTAVAGTNTLTLPAVTGTILTSSSNYNGFTPNGRLTLVSGTPVMNSNQTAKGTIYYTPYFGNLIIIYNGSVFTWNNFSELSVVLDATNVVSGNLYDLFVYSDSGTIRLGYGPAWTNTTTRSGAISQLNGIWTNTSTMTIRYSSSATTSVSANQATYVGTFYATANGQTGMSYFAATAGGGNPTLGLYNAYNRTKVSAQNIDTTTNWTYATASFRAANNSANNRISYVDGLAQTMVWATYTIALSATGGQTGYMAIGYDSTTNQGYSSYGQSNSASVFSFFSMANYNASLGFHYIQALELSTGATTTYYSGNNGGGLFALLEI